MQQPEYEIKGKKHLVCRLQKSIYGLKQSARCWNQKQHGVLIEIDLQQSAADQCLYIKTEDGKRVYILVYMDDMIVGCVDETLIDCVYHALTEHFEMTDQGPVSYFLGMEVNCGKGN